MKPELNRAEILRYLGHRGQSVDAATDRAVTDGIARLRASVKPRYIYRRFEIEQKADGIQICGAEVFLPGRDISNLLRNCRACVLLAATLGIEGDNLIRVAQSTSMLDSVVMDACATEYIEKICDIAQDEIAELGKKENCGLTFRYSPGYGDLPLEVQPALCRALDTGRRIGLTVSDSLIMIPRKSVTAVIGLTTKPETPQRPACETCSLRETCAFRKSGAVCGR